jgi:hypothetical protein
MRSAPPLEGQGKRFRKCSRPGSEARAGRDSRKRTNGQTETLLTPVQEGLAAIGRTLLNILAFLAILVIGYLVARLVRGVISKVLTRLGFDRVVERGGISRALARTDYDASAVVAPALANAVKDIVRARCW